MFVRSDLGKSSDACVWLVGVFLLRKERKKPAILINVLQHNLDQLISQIPILSDFFILLKMSFEKGILFFGKCRAHVRVASW